MSNTEPYYTIFCFIPGSENAFSVDVGKTRTVDHLKKAIKTAKANDLASIDADRLTLHRVEIKASLNKKEFMDELKRLSQNLNDDTDLFETRQVSDYFAVGPPEGKQYYVIVVVPKDGRVIPKEFRYVVVNGPGDLTFNRDFSLANTPIAFYSEYWGKGKDKVVDKKGEFRPKSPEPPLCVFEEYEYMQDRIDCFRTRDQKTPIPPGVAIIGTPGIGKSNFLNYYLACELSQSKHAVYYKGGTCYFFIGDTSTNTCRVYATSRVPHFGNGFHKILCLVDADTSSPAPDHLLQESCLFLVMAASPKKARIHLWMKQRAGGQNRKFVFNPPFEDELIHALRMQNQVDSSTADDEIRRAVRSYGPNMRTLARVLESPADEQSVNDNISMTAKALSPSALRKIIDLRTEALDEISHTIVKSVCLKRPKADDEGYLVDDLLEVTVSGPVVWRALVAAHQVEVYVELIHLLAIFAKIPQARGSAGWLWEHWVHAEMMKGGEFTLQRIHLNVPTRETRQTIHTGQKEAIPTTTIPTTTIPTTTIPTTTIPTTTQISIPPLTPLFFNVEEDASPNTSTYFLPTKTNNAAFDAFLFHHDQGIGLQITIASTHSLNEDGLTNLHKHLRDPNDKGAKPWFVAVIPKGQRFRYTTPPNNKDLKRFYFFTMDLALPDGAPPEPFMDDQPVDIETTMEPEDSEMLGDEN